MFVTVVPLPITKLPVRFGLEASMNHWLLFAEFEAVVEDRNVMFPGPLITPS